MNFYQLARDKNESIDFLRGRGKYFDADREREGEHDFSFTSYNAFSYAEIVGEETLYHYLSEDLYKLLNEPSFSFSDLHIVIKIIWMYNFFRKEDNFLKKDWIMDEKIINCINFQIDKLNKVDDEFKSCKLINEMHSRFNFSKLKNCLKYGK